MDAFFSFLFGTREGVNVYDGREILFYKGWVRGVQGEELWLGNDIHYVCRGKDGNMYIYSEENLYRYHVRGDFFRQLTFGGTTSTVVEDGGNVWFVQNDSIFRWDMEQDARKFVRVSPVTSPTALRITKDRLFIGARQGLSVCDYGEGDVRTYLDGVEIYSMFESRDEVIWIGTRMNGLYRMQNGRIEHLPYSKDGTGGIMDEQIREFAEDDEGNIWFGTFSGLQMYDVHHRQYARVDVPTYVGGLNHPSIFSLFKDHNGVIWVGSYYGGVNYFDPKRDGIVHYDYQDHTGQPLYYSLIGNMVKDKDGNLWLSTDGGGISCVDSSWNLVEQHTAGSGNALLHNNVKDIVYDEAHDCLFIGTYLGGLSRYDRRTKRFRNYLHQPATSAGGQGPGNVIHHLKLWQGDLYISSREGIFRLDIDHDRLERIVHALADLRGRHAHVFERKRHVLLDDRGDQLVIRILEHHRHGLAHLVGVVFVARVHHIDIAHAAGRQADSVEAARERTLARAVVPQHGDKLAALDGQVHALEHRHSKLALLDRIGVLQVFGFDDFRHK